MLYIPSDGMGELAATLENPLFSTSPMQSFQYARTRAGVSQPVHFAQLRLTALKSQRWRRRSQGFMVRGNSKTCHR